MSSPSKGRIVYYRKLSNSQYSILTFIEVNISVIVKNVTLCPYLTYVPLNLFESRTATNI